MRIKRIVLIKELTRLSKRLSEIVLSDFEPLTNAQLNWKLNPNQWSIGECLLHINLIYAHYLPLIENGIQQNLQKVDSAKNDYQSGLLGNFLIKRIQLGEDNVAKHTLKTANLFKPSTEDNLNGAETIRQYELYQQQLLSLLESAKRVNLEAIRIPFALLHFIRFRLGDLFRYIVYHNERHIVQAQKMRSEEQFPRTSGNEMS